jgi:hypothetical protein
VEGKTNPKPREKKGEESKEGTAKGSKETKGTEEVKA